MPENPNIQNKEYLRQCGLEVARRIPDGHGFILLTFNFGPDGHVFYVSNAQREDAIAAMKEFLIRASGEEEWMKHIR